MIAPPTLPLGARLFNASGQPFASGVTTGGLTLAKRGLPAIETAGMRPAGTAILAVRASRLRRHDGAHQILDTHISITIAIGGRARGQLVYCQRDADGTNQLIDRHGLISVAVA